MRSEYDAAEGDAESDPIAEHELVVGDEVELEIGPVAHGGVCVARADGRVVFVRFALPGERALVRITEAKRGSFCRGEAIEVLRADPGRVVPPCAHFGPGGCGGCDWQHASADLQRELKAAVVREQLQRLAGVTVPVTVEPLPGGAFAWRARVRWAVDRSARQIGPRRYRSHEVVPVSGDAPCLIAAAELSETVAALDETLGVAGGALNAADEVVLVDRGVAEPIVAAVSPKAAGGRSARQTTRQTKRHTTSRGPHEPPVVTERVADRSFVVDAAGFWQAHTHAAEAFTEVVVESLAAVDVIGGVAWDLYGGVGLFAPPLAASVGPGGQVVTVESDRRASAHAAANLADLPQVRAVTARVDRFVADVQGALDVALLDPPRSGAGAVVCRGIAERRPALIVYVACDPAALARDTAILLSVGYRLSRLRAFDAFPQTHHVECIATFEPDR